MSGRLELIIGCMFAGKTGEFIRRYRKYNSIGRKILVINHSSDTRYGKSVVSSHNRDKIDCISLSDFEDITSDDKYVNADIIMIDEAQFFKGLVEFVRYGMDVDNKHFIVCGLSGDCFRKPFGEILNLIPYCSDIKYLKALCKKCALDGIESEAIYSMRMTSDKCQTVVGSEDKYIPVCHKHYVINYFEEEKVDVEKKVVTKDSKKEEPTSDVGSNWILWGC